MTVKHNGRLCWNCDGTIGVDLSQCPYCGVLLEPIVSRFQTEAVGEDETVAAEPFSKPEQKPLELNDEKSGANDVQERKELTAFLLILPGATLALFGALLFFFAKDGTLTLAWRGNFAYFYMIGAIPLLFLGWRTLK